MFKKTLKKIRAEYRYQTSPFARFERSFHKDTRSISRKLVAWAQEEKNQPDNTVSDDPVVYRGLELRETLANQFKDKYSQSPLRVLIYLPDQNISPAGWSIYNNMKEAADFLGYETAFLGWDDDTSAVLDSFRPNIFLTSDSDKWLERIDWVALADYRASHQLLLGLTASTSEENSLPLEVRLAAARERNISFYYVYDPTEYLVEREDAYAPFLEGGCPLYTYEYTVNPLRFYPEAGYERDIDYIMLGSGYNNGDKRRLYMEWYERLWQDYAGVLYGPGWKGLPFIGMDGDRDRYLYARGKVGLNLSIPRQLKWHASLNERTYILAACGIPQLSDRALLLDKRFTSEEILMADTPEEYYEHFESLMHNPGLGEKLALNAQEKVLGRYTNFHSVEAFFTKLEAQLKEKK